MDNNEVGYPINSYVCSIGGCLCKENHGEYKLLNKKLVIPAYQRPYSWNEKNIDDFLTTIMDGFNSDRKKNIFFGTIQLNKVKEDNEEIYEIVDGQQRLTTFMLFLQALKTLENGPKIDFQSVKIEFRNLESAQNSYNKIITSNDINDFQKIKDNNESECQKDLYYKNYNLLREKLKTYIADYKIEKQEQELLKYVLANLYVVVLETNGEDLSLPEIVGIFNTINTTGLRLDDSDIFKLQYFDYLRYHGGNNDILMQIKECYEKIDKLNHSNKIEDNITISWVLDIYKHCICAKNGLKYEWLSKSNEKFFTDFFDKPKTENEQLNPEEILEFNYFRLIVDIFIDFWSKLNHDESEFVKSENINIYHLLSVKFIDYSRYGRYWTLPFVWSFFKIINNPEYKQELKTIGNINDIYKEALSVSFAIAKYFIINSINYAKQINPIHTKICNDILPKFAINNDDEIYEYIKDKIWKSPYNDNSQDTGKKDFENKLEKDAYSCSKIWVICLILALDAEQDQSFTNIKELLFSHKTNPFDIEHIWSISFNGENKKPENLNSLGNLVVLEREINRNLGGKKILGPSEKSDHYNKSKYKIVKDLIDKLGNWNQECIKDRTNIKIERLITLLN